MLLVYDWCERTLRNTHLRQLTDKAQQRIRLAHSVYRLLRARTMPITSVALSRRRTTTSAVHSADAPASHRRSTTLLLRPL